MRILPKRYSIFCGENNLSEVGMAFLNLIRLLLGLMPRKNINQFEAAVVKETGQKKAWFFSTARMGLFTALKALELEEGAEVIVPAFTCVVVPNAIIYAGLKPIYAEINEETFSSNLEQYKAKQSSRTKVIYVQHTFGIEVDTKPIVEWARKNKFYVIEDCAHSFGLNDGQGKSGDIALYSLDHSKILNVGYGGIIVSSQEKIIPLIDKKYLLARELPKRKQLHILSLFIWEYFMYHPKIFPFMKIPRAILSRMGFLRVFKDELIVDRDKMQNYPAKLSPYLCEIGISQVNNLKNNLTHRKEVVNYLSDKLNLNMENKPLLRVSVLVEERKKAEDLFKKDFELGIWFTTIFQGRTIDFDKVGYKMGNCPKAEYIAEHIFNFPTHSKIDLSYFMLKSTNKKLIQLKSYMDRKQ